MAVLRRGDLTLPGVVHIAGGSTHARAFQPRSNPIASEPYPQPPREAHRRTMQGVRSSGAMEIRYFSSALLPVRSAVCALAGGDVPYAGQG